MGEILFGLFLLYNISTLKGGRLKKLIMIGCGPGWPNAPDISDEHDTWGLNDLLCERPVNVGFQLHHRKDVSEEDLHLYDKSLIGDRTPGYLIYMLGDGAGYPKAAIRYPIEKIIEEFGVPYFSCSFAYMIALAILLGYKEIDLYGCTIYAEGEYEYQKSCIEFWIGMAMGRGIKVKPHNPTHICQTPDFKLYGYCMTYRELEHKVLQH